MLTEESSYCLSHIHNLMFLILKELWKILRVYSLQSSKLVCCLSSWRPKIPTSETEGLIIPSAISSMDGFMFLLGVLLSSLRVMKRRPDTSYAHCKLVSEPRKRRSDIGYAHCKLVSEPRKMGWGPEILVKGCNFTCPFCPERIDYLYFVEQPIWLSLQRKPLSLGLFTNIFGKNCALLARQAKHRPIHWSHKSLQLWEENPCEQTKGDHKREFTLLGSGKMAQLIKCLTYKCQNPISYSQQQSQNLRGWQVFF